MTAIIVATGQFGPDGSAMSGGQPTPLFPLVDRPFLQHVVEHIADAGIKRIDILLSQDADRIRLLLGDGARWGVTFSYNIVQHAANPYAVLRTIPFPGSPVLLAHGDRLPQVRWKHIDFRSTVPWVASVDHEWTGWALLPSEFWVHMRHDCNREALSHYVMETAQCQGWIVDSERVLGVRSYAEALESQRVALSKEFRGLQFGGRETQEGVWLGSNVKLDRTATLVPPVYIGERSRIGVGVRLGPNAVVGRECTIDRHSLIANSTLLPTSHIGEALELDHVVVDRNRLINIRVGGEITVTDDFILGTRTARSVRRSIRGAASALRYFARRYGAGTAAHRDTDSRPEFSAEVTDLRLKRKSIELSRMEAWLTFGPRHFLLRHENVIRPILRTGLKTTGLLARGERNALDLMVRQIRLPFETLPPGFCGFRLIHLSDIHVDGMPHLADRVVEVLRNIDGDLCVFTGDYRFATHGPCHNVYPAMKSIVQAVRAPHGMAGILGNHDYAEEIPELEALGIRMLVNAAVEVSGPAGSLWVAGVDDPYDYQCDDLTKALEGVPSEAFKILLVHSPDLIPAASSAGVRLYLCGHTHAGQIRLPGIGSIVTPSRVARRYQQGLWKYQGMTGFTSAGVGCSLLAVRFWCPPEIALIELRCAHHAASTDCCTGSRTGLLASDQPHPSRVGGGGTGDQRSSRAESRAENRQ